MALKQALEALNTRGSGDISQIIIQYIFLLEIADGCGWGSGGRGEGFPVPAGFAVPYREPKLSV